jgi:hypothetical protein
VIAGLEDAVERNRHDLDLQFVRITQLQAEIDALKKTGA